MSLAPKRPCTTPRCPNLTAGGPCETHKKQRQQASDARRGASRERGYTNPWSTVSKAHLARYPLCGMRAPDAYQDGWRGECHELGRIKAAECTDHIRPHKGDMTLFWDAQNRQSMCLRCNTLKAIRYEGGFGRASA